MDKKQDKIVLFPKQKEKLEYQAFSALQNKRYKEALGYFDQLMDYGIHDQDIVVGKLTCYVELGRERDAMAMCEDLIDREDSDYYTYINIYATLLFQFHKHKEVKDLLEEALSHQDIPKSLHNQLLKLKEVNESLVNEQVEQETVMTHEKIKEAVNNEDTMAQWHLVNHLQRADLSPHASLLESMLVDGRVHPVVKTVIVGLFQAESIDRDVEVSKFNQTIVINPVSHPFMNDHPFRHQLKKMLEALEQEDPTLYRFSNQLIDRYFYVNYPIVPPEDELKSMRDAVLAIVSQSLGTDLSKFDVENSEEVIEKMEMILEAEHIYFSILEE
ncbi:Protein of unknown function [Pelagirhabdus alkalitolerans]|uniref:Tetratricopeptide repeat-containing protein n=1 Tax=Pelagirhabdus alkalitolerans TaxID=1612202 RepID=A0A1G6HMD8_9BACI|nr:DUF3196 family protein [Pelagirhabdus alkalitolerans]SDB95429.1 Protein of unknown function [Pelagirhabdus alkalitolerans]